MAPFEDMTKAIVTTREFREMLLADPYRPGYHFAIPEDLGVPGDPNGAFYANGRFHLMYLYSSRTVGACWGHISSHDLVHWRHHADSIQWGEKHGGCFSGGAFLDDDGTAYLTYIRLPYQEGSVDESGVGIAWSSDRHYDHWEKSLHPIVQWTEHGITDVVDPTGRVVHVGVADPSNIWKKDGVYYVQIGNLCVLDKYGRTVDSPVDLRGDWVDLFKSVDIKTWEYVKRFYRRKASNEWTNEGEDAMCSSFLPLPADRNGSATSGKYLQLFFSHTRGCQYYIGEYDKVRDEFLPEIHGRMTWIDRAFGPPEALMDPKGRQIMWGWLTDFLDDDLTRGWSGVFGLPRVLWLGKDGTLRMAPVEEMKALRYNGRNYPSTMLHDGVRVELDGINGESSEIRFSIDPATSHRVGIKVRTSPNEEETTLLYYDAETGELVYDATASGGKGTKLKETAPFRLAPGERLELDVFIDRSVLEIFANDRQAITRRVYPARADSTGVYLFCEGGEAFVGDIETWEMMPSNPY